MLVCVSVLAVHSEHKYQETNTLSDCHRGMVWTLEGAGMSGQTHFHTKGIEVQVWATTAHGGSVPHGKVTKRVDERDSFIPPLGNSDRTLPTKAEAEAVAKATTMKYIDEHGS